MIGPSKVPSAARSGCSTTAQQHANAPCRRQIEKSPLAQIEMSLSAVSVGDYWADDNDCDEPDGDRTDERVARSGGWRDQGRRGIDVDGLGRRQVFRMAKAYGKHGPQALVSTARPAEQPLLSLLPTVA
jgi:hypothetical protein